MPFNDIQIPLWHPCFRNKNEQKNSNLPRFPSWNLHISVFLHASPELATASNNRKLLPTCLEKTMTKKNIWGTWKQMWNVSVEENGWWSALMLENSRKQHVWISAKSGDKLPNIYTYWVAGISEPSISISRMLSTRLLQAGRFDITNHLWHAAVMGPVLVPSRK